MLCKEQIIEQDDGIYSDTSRCKKPPELTGGAFRLVLLITLTSVPPSFNSCKHREMQVPVEITAMEKTNEYVWSVMMKYDWRDSVVN
jgi:hypothetical protein